MGSANLEAATNGGLPTRYPWATHCGRGLKAPGVAGLDIDSVMSASRYAASASSRRLAGPRQEPRAQSVVLSEGTRTAPENRPSVSLSSIPIDKHDRCCERCNRHIAVGCLQ